MRLGLVGLLMTCQRSEEGRTRNSRLAAHNTDDIDVEVLIAERLLQLPEGRVRHGLGVDLDGLLS